MTEASPGLDGAITALPGDAVAGPDDAVARPPSVNTAPFEVSAAPAGGPATARDRVRELLMSYHQTLGTLQVVASALLDATQADAGPITAEQARAYRRTAGEGLALVKHGDLLLSDLWRTFGVDRRLAAADAPPPRAVRRERRRHPGKGTAA